MATSLPGFAGLPACALALWEFNHSDHAPISDFQAILPIALFPDRTVTRHNVSSAHCQSQRWRKNVT